jgi:DNA-binding winged helix-turn-helix (wHTH) protein
MNMGLSVKQQSSREAAQLPAGDRVHGQTLCLRFGPFELDRHQEQLFKNGTQVKVQGKVYQALVALIEVPGELVTRSALRARLWPRDTHLNYDANVNTTVNKLRQVLGDSNEESKYIETIPRKGYSFVAKVDFVDGPAAVSGPNDAGARESRTSKWILLRPPQFMTSSPARIWFTASLVGWVVAAVLFGAALTLYSHRSIGHKMINHPAGQNTEGSSKP